MQMEYSEFELSYFDLKGRFSCLIRLSELFPTRFCLISMLHSRLKIHQSFVLLLVDDRLVLNKDLEIPSLLCLIILVIEIYGVFSFEASLLLSEFSSILQDVQ